MKPIIYKYIFNISFTLILFVGLMHVSSTQVLAQDDKYSIPWTITNVGCNSGYEPAVNKITTSSNIIRDRTIEKVKDLCVTENDSLVSGLWVSGFWKNDVQYCADGKIVPYFGTSSSIFATVDEGIISQGVCCDSGFSYYYQSYRIGVCCSEPGGDPGKIIGITSIDCSAGGGGDTHDKVGGVFALQFNTRYYRPSQINNYGQTLEMPQLSGLAGNMLDGYFHRGDPKYTCKDGVFYGCVPGELLPSTDKAQDFVNIRKCYKVGAPNPNGGGLVCFNGKWIPQADYNQLGPFGLLACQEFRNLFGSDEEAKCRACFDKNDPNGGVANYVYTSLGCVDTSQRGVTVRVLQIGIGIIGGFAVLKVMFAAFKMQSKDPNKLQEAKEELTSVVLAIILLVGGIVILNIIGFNILQILPFNFFDTLVN
jgi:hypothetical protein